MSDIILDPRDSFFSPRFLWVKLFAALYVLAIPVSHSLLPAQFVWELALAFLLLMLPPYPMAAWRSGTAFGLELSVALGLAALTVGGYVLGAPALIIAAIFGHGLWDVAKVNGLGTPFFGWYLSGCMLVDWVYAGALVVHLSSGGSA